MKPRKSYTKRN